MSKQPLRRGCEVFPKSIIYEVLMLAVGCPRCVIHISQPILTYSLFVLQ
jgi:hypothetical protein